MYLNGAWAGAGRERMQPSSRAGLEGQNVTLRRSAAVLYAIISFGVIAFQIALPAGAPWGAFAMGGAFPGQFPPALRVGALIQAALLGAMAAVVLARAGLMLPGWTRVSR